MTDRTCPCGKEFQYPYLMLKHLNNKPKCKALYDQLQLSINEDSICKYCLKKLVNKFSCNRHEVICKSKPNNKINNKNANINDNVNANNNIQEGKAFNALINLISIIANNNNENDNIKNVISQNISSILLSQPQPQTNNQFQNINNVSNNKQPIIADNNNELPQSNVNINGKIEIVNNTNHQESINNGIVNNVNITINNHINEKDDKIPYVYPFGCENINFLTDAETLEILKSPNGACLVLDKIYSHVDNNNFMKLNKKDKRISYIHSAEKVKFCSIMFS